MTCASSTVARGHLMKPNEDHSNCCCKKAYTVREAAKSVGAGVTTINEAIRGGYLIATYIGAKHSKPVVRSADLERWLDSQPIDK